MVFAEVTGQAVVVLNNSSIPIITEVGKLGLWLQAVGLVTVIIIILEVIAFYFNRKRFLELMKIKNDMVRIEGKIDKILVKKRN